MSFMSRLAHWTTHASKRMLAVWAVLLVLAAPLAWQAPARLTGTIGELPNTESTQVTAILRQDFGEEALNPVLLVVRGGGLGEEAALDDYRASLARVEGVLRVRSSRELGLKAPGGAELLVALIPLHEGADEALAGIRHYTAGIEAAGGLDIRITGGQAIADDFARYAESDTKRSEVAALPLIAGVLVAVFGALTASALPVMVGLLSITLAMALLYLLGGVMDVATFTQSVVTMLGLGAGIDYALLMVSRFREELRAGQSSAAAAQRAMLTAGRSVVWSGSTVMIAMSGLLFTPIPFVQSIGLGGMLTVVMTVLAAVTALPAVLALLGERVNRSPKWLPLQPGRLAESSAFWERWARGVMHRPWRWTLLGVGTLLLLAAPVRHVELGYGGAWGLSEGIESREALTDIREMGAGGLLSQIEVVLPLARPYDPAADAEPFRQTAERLKAVPGVETVVSPFLKPEDLRAAAASRALGRLETVIELNKRTFAPSGEYLRLTVVPDRYLDAREVARLVPELRAALQAGPHPAFRAAPLLGGAPIGEQEFSAAIARATPLAVATVFGATFLLMLMAFRSLVVPLKSILLNGLTVLAAVGLVAAVQLGPLAPLLGFPAGSDIVETILPLLLFTILFGLSMDYEIFLISRVHEGVMRGEDNDAAVAGAVGRTARIITSAALIMFAVFAAFVPGRVVLTKSIGLGLGAAVLLDATLVRLVLVPAVMKLAGRWNWWLPPALERALPRIKIEH